MMWQKTWMVAFTALLLVNRGQADNWPAWRGAKGDGISQETNLPAEFSRERNVTWKTSLPGPGNSTPIVWDEHVFLTCATDNGKVRSLFCLDRNTGRVRWRYNAAYPDQESAHSDNPYCSGSPTTDGSLVYASFDSAGVVACDFSGKVVWRRELGKLKHVFGPSSTPVLYKNLLIVHRGPGEPTHIVALDKRTGETVWNTPEKGIDDKLYGSWSTPVFYQVNGRDEFALSMPGELKGYDPQTGKEIWKCVGLGPSNYPDTAVGNGVLIGVSGFQKSMMAIRMGGRGLIDESARLWHVEKTQQRIGSGVVKAGYLYLSNAPGIAECVEVATGKTVWKERLGGNLWGSVLCAGERLYVANTEGKIFVMAASPKFELLATNDLAEHIKAAIAPSDGQLFVRTYENIYCVGRRR